MSQDDLHRRLDGPLYNTVLKRWVGKGELDYEVYLRTPTLLALQLPHDELSVPEELMFQVTHQAQELWAKLAAHEGAELVGDLDAGRTAPAAHRAERMTRIQRVMTDEMHVLHTLGPQTYQTIRRHLGNGSGQESPGYNAILLAAEEVRGALERLFARRGVTLEACFRGDEASGDLYLVCERILDYDAAFQEWLFAHYLLVRRTIGIDRKVRALDGFPTAALLARVAQPLFPALWDLRVTMTATWTREGGSKPGAGRTPPEQP